MRIGRSFTFKAVVRSLGLNSKWDWTFVLWSDLSVCCVSSHDHLPAKGGDLRSSCQPDHQSELVTRPNEQINNELPPPLPAGCTDTLLHNISALLLRLEVKCASILHPFLVSLFPPLPSSPPPISLLGLFAVKSSYSQRS